MLNLTVGDVVAHARQFEDQLGRYYDGLARESHNQRVRRLAGYMGRHYRRLAEALAGFETDQRTRLCSARIPFVPEDPDARRLPDLPTPAEADIDQVLEAAIACDERLVKFYRYIASQPIEASVREIFENLADFEQADEIELKKLRATTCL